MLKEILVPGRVYDVRSKRWFTITPQDVRDGARNLSTMYERGRRVPVVLEHQDVEVGDPAEWKANFAKYTVGYTAEALVSTPEHVKKGIASRPGTLLAWHDIYDKNDAKQLARLKASPKLYQSYTDSDGHQYSGCTPVHVAATPLPAQPHQAPFQIELSNPNPVFLAYPAPARTGRAVSPAQSRRRGDARLLSTTPGATAMADEKDDDKEYEGGEGGGKNADLQAVIDAITSAFPNARIPDEVSDWKQLVIAIKANGAAAPEEAPEADEPENPDDDLTAPGKASGEDTTAPPGGAPMMMSTLDRDPKRRARAQESVKPERDEAAARVNAALKAGKCDGPTARKLLRVFESVELSVLGDGTVADADPKGKRWEGALAELAKVEKARPGTAAAVELSATVPGPGAPAALTGAAADKAEAIANWLVKGAPPPK